MPFAKILLLYFCTNLFMYLSLINFEFLDVKDPYLKQDATPLFFIFAFRHTYNTRPQITYLVSIC